MEKRPNPEIVKEKEIFHLLPYERLLSIKEVPERLPAKRPSGLREIMRLTGVTRTQDIGKKGPSIASLAFESNTAAPEDLHLYETVFGRDSLRVAIDLLPFYPELAKATTLELAKLQGTTYYQEREEEPGRIVHEARDPHDPIAVDLTKRLGWQWPYYGSVDATPEFVRTLVKYCQLTPENTTFLQQTYTDKDGREKTMQDALGNAIAWIEHRLDSNDEGILEFKSVLEHGIENQVWKDSWDAYHHADGTIANHEKGVSSIEVQVKTFDALRDAADLYETALQSPEKAHQLHERAEKMRATIMKYFWTEEKGGYFVLGTDRDEAGAVRQLNIRTSNMGHVLYSQLLEGNDPENIRKREAVIDHLLSPEMLNVSGVRTLASDEVRFRPGAYHNGSVWLWDTHYIANGMKRLGYTTHADMLANRLLHIINVTRAFPEYVSGDDAPVPHINHRVVDILDEIHHRINRVEQPPQEVQAWTVAAIVATKRQRHPL